MGRNFASCSTGYHRRRWWQTHGYWVISSQNGRPMTRILIEIRSTNLQHFVGKYFATMSIYCSSANFHLPELAYVDSVTPSFLFYLLVDLLNKSFCSSLPNLFIYLFNSYISRHFGCLLYKIGYNPLPIYFDVEILPVWPVGGHPTGSATLLILWPFPLLSGSTRYSRPML